MPDLSSLNQQHLFGSDVILGNLLEPADMCWVIQKEVAPLIKDSDFESLYKDGGRPPVSPRILVLTLLMQFLERLPDRAAIQNLKFRLDWKIAFGLPVDFAGFHPTTLVHFRTRLAESPQGALLFDRVIEHLRKGGLIKKSGKQRIDSTHIIACVRELSRIELLHETLRLFCIDVSGSASSMSSDLTQIHERYSDKVSTYGATDLQRKDFVRSAGLGMKALILWATVTNPVDAVQSLKSFTTLKAVFEQNFTDEGSEPELIRIATGAGHICSPHEPEARYANKGKKGWLGYKGQVVETVNGGESGLPNFITHIDIQDAPTFDGDCVVPIVQQLKDKDITPESLYGDTHYNTAANIEALQKDSIDLKGPVQPVVIEKAEKHVGFQIDLEGKKVVCPMGVESKHFHVDPNGKIGASFPKASCVKCPRRTICKPEPRGKIYSERPENKTLTKRREQMKDRAYLEDLHKRNGIEGCISGLVRGQNWRHCRYRGKNKARLQARLTGAATNVTRLHRYRAQQHRLQQNGDGLAA